MELRQLRYFVAVAEDGGFSRAAARLHVSQPPLSLQIQSLERELGVQLLERSNRGVSVTAAGAVFLEEARGVLARLEQARQRAIQTGRGEAGTLSVGFVSIADYSILPPALKDFRARFAGAQAQLHELTTDAQILALRDARLDLGIALAPVNETDMEFQGITREQLVLAAPAAHPATRGSGAVDLRGLSGESFIVPPRDIAPGLHDLIIGRCLAAGFAPRITQQARQMQTVIGLVSSGMGFALVPESVRNLKRAGVQYRPLRGRPAWVELGMLWLRGAVNPLRGNFAGSLLRAAAEARK